MRYEKHRKAVTESKKTIDGLRADKKNLHAEYAPLQDMAGLIRLFDDEVIEAVQKVQDVGDSENLRIDAETDAAEGEKKELSNEIKQDISKMNDGLSKLHKLQDFRYGNKATEQAVAESKKQIGKYNELLNKLDETAVSVADGGGGARSADISNDASGEALLVHDDIQDCKKKSTSFLLTNDDREQLREGIRNGTVGEKDIRDIGSRVMSRHESLMRGRDRELTNLIDHRRDLIYQMKNTNNDEKKKELMAQIADSRQLENNIRKSETNDALFKQALGEMRPIGPKQDDIGQLYTNKNDPAAQQAIESLDRARNLLPTDWIEKSNSVPIEVKQVERGYYYKDSDVSTIALSGSGRGMDRVAYHELGHHFEEVFPEIQRLEHEFYNRRTEGERLRWLGFPYRFSEKTRRDNFIDPYMGKDYGNTYTSGYELFSMGLEGLCSGSYNLNKDPEYRNFILGVLSAI